MCAYTYTCSSEQFSCLDRYVCALSQSLTILSSHMRSVFPVLGWNLQTHLQTQSHTVHWRHFTGKWRNMIQAFDYFRQKRFLLRRTLNNRIHLDWATSPLAHTPFQHSLITGNPPAIHLFPFLSSPFRLFLAAETERWAHIPHPCRESDSLPQVFPRCLSATVMKPGGTDGGK